MSSTHFDRRDEFTIDLVVAVLQGDIARAREVVAMRLATMPDDEARVIWEAKRRAGQLPRSGAELARPFVLPAPGAKVGDTLSGECQMPRIPPRQLPRISPRRWQ